MALMTPQASGVAPGSEKQKRSTLETIALALGIVRDVVGTGLDIYKTKEGAETSEMSRAATRTDLASKTTEPRLAPDHNILEPPKYAPGQTFVDVPGLGKRAVPPATDDPGKFDTNRLITEALQSEESYPTNRPMPKEYRGNISFIRDGKVLMDVVERMKSTDRLVFHPEDPPRVQAGKMLRTWKELGIDNAVTQYITGQFFRQEKEDYEREQESLDAFEKDANSSTMKAFEDSEKAGIRAMQQLYGEVIPPASELFARGLLVLGKESGRFTDRDIIAMLPKSLYGQVEMAKNWLFGTLSGRIPEEQKRVLREFMGNLNTFTRIQAMAEAQRVIERSRVDPYFSKSARGAKRMEHLVNRYGLEDLIEVEGIGRMTAGNLAKALEKRMLDESVSPNPDTQGILDDFKYIRER